MQAKVKKVQKRAWPRKNKTKVQKHWKETATLDTLGTRIELAQTEGKHTLKCTRDGRLMRDRRNKSTIKKAGKHRKKNER